MSGSIDNFSPKQWEKFCEIMLRQHHGQRNFYKVPDQDNGDYGLEFFTADGTLYQCYYPDPGVEMATYKKKIQTKINDDLKKLKTYESEIQTILDDISINQWILLTPEHKSKDLISYCHKKKKEVITQGLSFIDKTGFLVKIETADSYPQGKLYAHGVESLIKIPLVAVSDEEKNVWVNNNSVFHENIKRKSNALDCNNPQFQNQVIEKYIQIYNFLETLRTDYPDLHELIEDSARAQLENIENDALFKELNKEFVQNATTANRGAFTKYSMYMSDSNTQLLAFGYLSKWLAECYMDFK